MSEAPARKIIRTPAVCKRTGKSRTQIWRDVRDKKFPAPVQLGPNAIGWYENEIDFWLETRPRVSWAADVPLKPEAAGV